MGEEPDIPSFDDQPKQLWPRVRRFLFGKPRDIAESSLFHRLTLIPILAWVGLGADGLSSSAYGPEEAFRALGEHTYLAFGLAIMTAFTVAIIASAYSRIIEEFPAGGGGYLVASKLLGEKVGVVSGSALLIDYALTIAVSLTAAGDAIFSLLPLHWQIIRLPFTIFLILGLTIINIRGVRESVLMLAPIFVLFIITHAILIGVGFFSHLSAMPEIVSRSTETLSRDYQTLGFFALLSIFMHAYSLGGGTYTGLEAVSNGMPIMREPKVHTARRTMLYMAVSLSITAAGLIACYMLWNVTPEPGKTMSAVLAAQVGANLPLGGLFVALTLLAAGALLVVGAQAGFIDGPRVLANMAVDYWVPRHFSTLSERLTTRNGIVMMGAAALILVAYTGGNIHHLVVMYSINVFLTFSLSMFGMLRMWLSRRSNALRIRRVTLFLIGFLLCGTVLVITIVEKFTEGGWITVVVTGLLVMLCFGIRRHYRKVSRQLSKLNMDFADLPIDGMSMPTAELLPDEPTAAMLVSGYSGLGIQTLLNILSVFPRQFKNVVFLSVGVVDSGEMKGAEQIQRLREQTEASLKKYVKLAAYLDFPATYKMAVGADVILEAVTLCNEVVREYPKTTFFAGQLVFQHESWLLRLLHNQTAFSIQRRLLFEGKTMVILPVRLR